MLGRGQSRVLGIRSFLDNRSFEPIDSLRSGETSYSADNSGRNTGEQERRSKNAGLGEEAGGRRAEQN